MRARRIHSIRLPSGVRFIPRCLLVVALALSLAAGGCMMRRDGSSGRETAALAPNPATTPEAVIQVYGARTMGFKGIFGVHTWVAVKATGAQSYTVYEVIGWRLRWGDAPV